MVKHIIFDFGGVFLDLKGKHTGVPANLAKIFNIPEEKAAKIWQENKNDLLIGKETPKKLLIRMNALLGVSLDPDITHESWIALNKMEKNDINWPLVEYVENLKDRYQIHMLTNVVALDNTNSEWYNSAIKHFHNIYRSFEIGHKKPNKEAFLHVLEKISANPEECVFIDDIQVNVDAANTLGIKGILYTNFDQLEKDFSALGID